jgi:hypothetical protein
MKQLLCTALVATFCFVMKSNATIRRVGYFGTATALDYTDFQTAHDAANAGDTIYLYPGNWSVSLSKKLVIMGYGYFLGGTGANAGQQVVTAGLSAYVYLSPGSDNTVFDGVDGLGIDPGNMNGAVSTGIIIKHCLLTTAYFDRCPITNWQITQTCVDAAPFYLPGTGSVINLKVNNCIFRNGNFQAPGGTGNTGQFTNCVFDNNYNLNIYNNSYLFKNCIFTCAYSNVWDANSAVFQNNIFNSDAGDTTGTPATNKSVSFGTVSVFSTSTSNDNHYSLATSSPAKGFGAGGIDCGAFGGTTPYILSGLPAVPAIIKLTSSSTSASANPYTITLSVQSH